MKEIRRKATYKNTLLKRFDDDLIGRLQLQRVDFVVGQEIENTGDPIRHLYFLETGMASMTTSFENGSQVEVGMFGFESVIGVSALMGTIRSLNRVYIRIPGWGYGCAYEVAHAEYQRHGLFQKLLLRYVQAQLVQAIQSAGCNAVHNFEQRLARWLLITADRADSDRFPISQEILSHMLGVTRPTVTIAAGQLKKENLIEYTRGEITILDRKSLKSRACECFQVIKNHLDDLQSFDARCTA